VEILPIDGLRTRHKDDVEIAANYGIPVASDGEVDFTEIDKMPGGRRIFNLRWIRHRRNLVLATVVSAWSYDLPLPVIAESGELLNEDSIGETDTELTGLIDAYVEKLLREPNPKAATTSASNGRSRAKAADLKA
jgi:hypothetical protein